jgi:hypothetical protein
MSVHPTSVYPESNNLAIIHIHLLPKTKEIDKYGERVREKANKNGRKDPYPEIVGIIFFVGGRVLIGFFQ